MSTGCSTAVENRVVASHRVVVVVVCRCTNDGGGGGVGHRHRRSCSSKRSGELQPLGILGAYSALSAACASVPRFLSRWQHRSLLSAAAALGR